MRLFRVSLRLQGPYASPMASGMIFGQLCWARREAESEAALAAWLAESASLWAISDVLPAGWLPRPMLAPRPGTANTVEDAARHKRLGKLPLIRREAFVKHRAALDPGALTEHDLGGSPDREHRTARNSIDRHTSRARDDGGLFSRAEWWPPESEAARDLYVEAPDEDRGRIADLLRRIGEQGFGKAASLGRGRFTVEAVQPDDELARGPREARWLSLSRGTRTAAMGDVLCRLETHFGKTGPQVAVGDGGSPFKRPILLTRPGATFRRAGEGRFGAWLTGVHPTRPEIGHNAFHLAIPFAEAHRA